MRGRTKAENMPGGDIETSIRVSFTDACKGTTRSVTVHPLVQCTTCSGSGLKPGAKRSQCGTCGGTGTQTFVVDGGFHMASTCSTCNGTGSTVPRSSECGSCGGMGAVKVRRSVEVHIPEGSAAMHSATTPA